MCLSATLLDDGGGGGGGGNLLPLLDVIPGGGGGGGNLLLTPVGGGGGNGNFLLDPLLPPFVFRTSPEGGGGGGGKFLPMIYTILQLKSLFLKKLLFVLGFSTSLYLFIQLRWVLYAGHLIPGMELVM